MANWPGYSVTVVTKSLENEVVKFIMNLACYDHNEVRILGMEDIFIVKSYGSTPWLGTLKPLCDMIQNGGYSADLSQRCGNLCVGHTFKWRRGKCLYQEMITLPYGDLLHEAKIKGIDIPKELPDKIIGEKIPDLEDQLEKYYSDTCFMRHEEIEAYNKRMDVEFEKALEKTRKVTKIEDPYKEYYELVKNTPYPNDYPFTPTNNSKDNGLELPIDPYYSEPPEEDINDDDLPF